MGAREIDCWSRCLRMQANSSSTGPHLENSTPRKLNNVYKGIFPLSVEERHREEIALSSPPLECKKNENLQSATKLLTLWSFQPPIASTLSLLLLLSWPFSPFPQKTMLYRDFMNLKLLTGNIRWGRQGLDLRDLKRGRNRSVILHIKRTLQTCYVN